MCCLVFCDIHCRLYMPYCVVIRHPCYMVVENQKIYIRIYIGVTFYSDSVELQVRFACTLNASFLTVCCDVHVWELSFRWNPTSVLVETVDVPNSLLLVASSSSWGTLSQLGNVLTPACLPWGLLWVEHPRKIALDIHLGGLLSRCLHHLASVNSNESGSTSGPSQMFPQDVWRLQTSCGGHLSLTHGFWPEVIIAPFLPRQADTVDLLNMRHSDSFTLYPDSSFLVFRVPQTHVSKNEKWLNGGFS